MNAKSPGRRGRRKRRNWFIAGHLAGSALYPQCSSVFSASWRLGVQSGIAIAPYVGVSGDMASIDNASLTLDGLFKWMNNFTDTTLDGWIKSNKGVADAFGVSLEAYEGGQSLTATNGLNESLKQAAQDDPRMGDFYKHLIGNWVADGGHIFGNFALATPNSKYGYWGALQSIDQASSVKYSAVLSMIGGAAAPATSAGTGATTAAASAAASAPEVYAAVAVATPAGYAMVGSSGFGERRRGDEDWWN